MRAGKKSAVIVISLMVLTVLFSILMAISNTAPGIAIASSMQKSGTYSTDDGANTTNETEEPQSIEDEQKNTALVTILVIAGISGFAVLVVVGGIKYIGRDNVLDTPVRASIYKYVQEHPGAHLRQICNDLDINVTNATWHLRKLEETHYVTKKKEGKFLKYYPLERKTQGNPRDFI